MLYHPSRPQALTFAHQTRLAAGYIHPGFSYWTVRLLTSQFIYPGLSYRTVRLVYSFSFSFSKFFF
jgi:hypothetical protein